MSNFDLSAQGYADWARFSGGVTAEVEMPDAAIIESDLIRVSPSSPQVFNSAHTFAQGTDNDNMTTAISGNLGSPPSLIATFSLAANTDYSIELFTRVVVTASRDRNDVLVTATIGEESDTFIIDDETHTASGGAGIYRLQVSGLASDETLTIELSGLPDDNTITSSAGFTVRLGAVGVEAVGPPDTEPPLLVLPTSPENGATGVPVVSPLVASFNEPIALEDGGTILLDHLGGGSDILITLPDPQVAAVDGDLVITPDSPLAAAADYSVQIGTNTIKDLAATPNFFAGIADSTTWSFQTNADGTGPLVVPPTTPADDSAEAATTTNLVAVFDEPLAAGSGRIVIRNLSGGTELEIPVSDPQVTLAGHTLTIDPATDLAPGADHAVRIDPGAVTDLLGNPFAGISDDTSWNFTTAADLTPPAIASRLPADEGAVRSTGSLVLTFSEPVTVPAPTVLGFDFEEDDGGFTVSTTDGSAWAYGTPDSSSPGGVIDGGNGADSGSGSAWGTRLGSYDGGTGDPGFYAVPTATCLRSAPIDLTAASSAQLTFAQAYDLAPDDTAVVHLIDDATETVIAEAIHTVASGSTGWTSVAPIDLSAGLGQVVRIEWCFTGTGGGTNDYLGWYLDDVTVTLTAATADNSIRVRNLSKGTETSYTVDDPEITLDGQTLTIAPAAPLIQGDQYAVRIGPGTITDLSGNFFPGITDDSAWNFTVASTLVLTVVADTYIRTGQGPQNGDPDNELLVGSFVGGSAARALLRFDTSTVAALEGIDLIGATLVGTNRDSQGGAGGTMNLSAHEYPFAFVEEAATWADPDGDGSPATDDTSKGGTLGTLVATASNHSPSANAVATFASESTLLARIETALIGDNTLNLIVKQDTEANVNRYARFSDEDQPSPFRLEIDYLGGGGTGGNTFGDWIGGFAGLGGQTGLNDDPDGEGIENGVENFFGTDPGEFSRGLLATAMDPATGIFTFTHPVHSDPAEDLTATYRWSTDLATFHDDGNSNGAGTTVSFTQGPAVDGVVSVTAAITGTVIPDRLFVDVEVTQN